MLIRGSEIARDGMTANCVRGAFKETLPMYSSKSESEEKFLWRLPLRLGDPGAGEGAFLCVDSYIGPSYPNRRIFGGRSGRLILGGSDFIQITDVKPSPQLALGIADYSQVPWMQQRT